MLLQHGDLDFIACPIKDDPRKVIVNIFHRPTTEQIDAATVEVKVVDGLNKDVYFDVIDLMGRSDTIFKETNILVEMMLKINEALQATAKDIGDKDWKTNIKSAEEYEQETGLATAKDDPNGTVQEDSQ